MEMCGCGFEWPDGDACECVCVSVCARVIECMGVYLCVCAGGRGWRGIGFIYLFI